MEKSDIKGEIPPNAAPSAAVEAVKLRIEQLGLQWHEVIAKAGLSRMTGFRLLNGKASTGSLRTVEEWVAREESRKPPQTRAQSKTTKTSEWAALGAELADLDPVRFEQILDGLRDTLRAKRIEAAANIKMFRPNPDRSA